jgi:plastocyanin
LPPHTCRSSELLCWLLCSAQGHLGRAILPAGRLDDSRMNYPVCGKDRCAWVSCLVEGPRTGTPRFREASSKGGFIVRLRKRHFPFAILLGVAVGVVPTIASSSTNANITAVDHGTYEHSWEANGLAPAEVGVTPGASVSFAYPTGVNYHYPIFKTGPVAPTCEGLPHSFAEASPGWSGSCTFTAEGTYEFWCGVHGATMKAFVYVNAGGTVSTRTTSTTTTSTFTGTTSTYTPPVTTTTATTTTQPLSSSSATVSSPVGAPAGTPPTPPAAGTSTTSGSPLAGSASSAIGVATVQRGSSIHGSIAISPAGAGARLEVDLLAATASLARKHSKQARIGRFVSASVTAGKMSFSVSLNAQAKRALHRRHRLPVIVQITLTPVHGTPLTSTRSVIVRS